MATVWSMLSEEELAWRRGRLQELVDHPDFGAIAALGRALGYQDGAYVRQMVAGERVISEKTIAKIESLKGGRFRGWFTRPADDLRAWPFTDELWRRLQGLDAEALRRAENQVRALLEMDPVPRPDGASGKRRPQAA